MTRNMLALILLFLFAGNASAGIIHYDESIDGDLPGQFTLTALTLDVGSNTVRGTVGLNVPNIGNDFDSFAFIIPDDTQLTSLTVSLDSGGVVTRASWRITEDGSLGGTILEDDFVVFAGGATFVSTAVPLGPGIYSVDARSLGGGGPVGASPTSPYLFTLEVESTNAVPEPSSLALLATGAISHFGYRWRRRKKQAA